MKAKWLNRSLVTGPYLTLCTSEEEFAAVLKHIKWSGPPVPFHASEHANATANCLYGEKGELVAAVCVTPDPDMLDSEVCALMAHEAVHVWREFLDSIGEKSPGEEIEAYAIQSITLWLSDELLSR